MNCYQEYSTFSVRDKVKTMPDILSHMYSSIYDKLDTISPQININHPISVYNKNLQDNCYDLDANDDIKKPQTVVDTPIDCDKNTLIEINTSRNNSKDSTMITSKRSLFTITKKIVGELYLLSTSITDIRHKLETKMHIYEGKEYKRS